MKISFPQLIILAFAMVSLGCEQKPVVRVYEDMNAPAVEADKERPALPEGHPAINQNPGMNTNDPQMQAMIQQSVAQIPLSWTAPKGWSEEKGSGMRLVTFTTEGNDPIICTIVSLSGMAGGLESNIIRWMKQINLNEDLIAGDKMKSFIEKQEKYTSQNNLSVQMIDLTQLSTADPTAPNILGAVVQIQDTTIFLKMTGTLKAINENRDAFKSLCQSLSFDE